MYDNLDIKNLNPLIWAFVGDSVYNLWVKQYLVGSKLMSLSALHIKAAKILSCEFQSSLAEDFVFILSEEESEIYRRAKNSHVKHIPKHASVAEYHRSTALEAVFGYLFLKGEIDRIKELFESIRSKIDDSA